MNFSDFIENRLQGRHYERIGQIRVADAVPVEKHVLLPTKTRGQQHSSLRVY